MVQPLFLILGPLTLPCDTLLGCKALSFSPPVLAAAILKGCSKDEIKGYIQNYDRDIVERQISDNICGSHSALFFAAKRAELDIMELLLEYGADPEAKAPKTNIPLLAVMIMWTKWTYKNVDKSVALLLSHGASPHCIPEFMWSIYIKDAYGGVFWICSQSSRRRMGRGTAS